MHRLTSSTVDVYVIDDSGASWRVLALRRAPGTRCTGAWETVHGRMEARESAEDAAVREVAEETGLEVLRLYVVSVQPFYMRATGAVDLAVVFAAFVRPAPVRLGSEHDAFEWLAPDAAAERFVWPREKVALAEIRHLLAGGDAGPVEDVLRVR